MRYEYDINQLQALKNRYDPKLVEKAFSQALDRTQAKAATTSSAPALSIEELIANSIAQKESVIGRELSADEKADMTAKVKKLMGA